MYVTIHQHKKRLGHTSAVHERMKILVKRTIENTLANVPNQDFEVDVYNLTGIKSSYNVGNKDRLVIFINNCHKESQGEPIVSEQPLVINGLQTKITTLLPNVEEMLPIKSEEGLIIAEHYKKQDERGNYIVNELNILIDLFDEHAEEQSHKAVFEYIMKEVNRLVFLPLTLRNSWKHTSEREALTNRFTGRLQQAKRNEIEDLKYRIDNDEAQIKEWTREIKRRYDQIINNRNRVERETANLDKVGDTIVKQLDDIINHPKIKDLHIIDDKFVVYTEPIYAHHDKEDKRYYIGNMRIELRPDNTEIKFFGDNPRRSHWSDNDPHPHVNGRNGSACLGNVAETIAQLSSQMEIYALALIGIDFLESVNTSDPAGRNIVNWDEVDEDGNIIEIEPAWTCPCCGQGQRDEESRRTVYNTLNEMVDEHGDIYHEVEDEIQVCPRCLDTDYEYNDEVEEYVHIDA